MHHHRTLREIAKIATGFVVADIVAVLLLSSPGIVPVSILGVVWTGNALPEVLAFDAALLVLLAHFGWHVRLPIESPSERTLLLIAGTIFLVVALVHLIRLALGLQLALGSFMVPLWLSWAGFIVTAYLSYSSFHFALARRA